MLSIEELTEKIKVYEPNADFELVKKAFEFAQITHKDQKRLSDEPFITHPMAVAEILTQLEQDSTAICASLLHDAIEDGGITEKQVADLFGDNVAKLVAGVTKLGRLSFDSKEEQQAENFRKMFLAMGEDIRVIVIKLADRLHNMRTLKYLSPEKQKETSLETKEIFAPLAHRLGIWSLKWELEDLAFYHLERDKFDQIKGLVAQKKEEREAFMKDFIAQVKVALEKVAIKSAISGRTKHFYSIYQKLVQKNVEFDDIYDLIAIRVLVDSVKDCYAVLGVIHSIWKPIPGRFRDFIAMPKPNGYKTLHTTVIGHSGKPVEVQIRTKEMHKAAEYGIAAHWRYKEKDTDKAFDSKLAWLRQMLDYQKDVKDAKDFMESLKIDLFIDEVFVYTPKGAVFSFPVDSTPVDFAYHVHTQVGNKCIGAKVNGKIVPLDYKLKTGDIIEILTGSKESPSFDWLDFVKTSGARAKIKHWLKKQKREENVERGRLLLLEELNGIGIDDAEALEEASLSFLFNSQNIASAEDLFALIGWGEMGAFATAKKVRHN
ncbi:MAG: bifunctional (p)ppGpp synthetase/guanosine-3',5'-bis(diphosphate) 3'-pyrophosphohydrolase, partial [Candidatus Margulisiibacteriota bacterium]